MKISFLKTVSLENKRRGAVVWSLLVCWILVASTSGVSQVKTQKRITALQLGDAVEGARVTIVSDSALNDYEAFRRGDRFYVRIPLADFTTIPPSFRADGFEDVQVQKVGDGLLVSFRLQPGASARVEQRTNRLDVIFSAPNRTLRNSMASESTRAVPFDRGADAAGPMPPGTTPAFSRGGTTYGAGEFYGGQEGRNPRLPFNSPGNPAANSSRGAGNQAGNQSTFRLTPKSPSPLASPSSVLSPSTSGSFPPATSATPLTSGSYQPAASASPAGSAVVSGTSSWQARGDAAMKWMSANRLATVLAALILLALIVYLILALGRWRKNQVKAKRLKAPKVQPKIEPVTDAPFESTVPSHVESSHASAAAVTSTQGHPWGLTKSSTNSLPVAPGAASSEEQDREVFEL
jgi:hypothetical protein